MRIKFALCALMLVTAAPAAPAAADTTLQQTGRGWYDQQGSRNSTNYLTGRLNALEYRSFFVFDLTGVSGPITSAELKLGNPSSPGYSSPYATETLGIWDFSSSITNLTGGTGGTGAFADLGSGTSFGTVSVSNADNGGTVTITLNAAALAAINGTSGLIAFGASIPNFQSASANENIFGFTFQEDVTQLVLHTSAVPEPAAWSLMIAAFALLGLALGGRRVAGAA